MNDDEKEDGIWNKRVKEAYRVSDMSISLDDTPGDMGVFINSGFYDVEEIEAIVKCLSKLVDKIKKCTPQLQP